MNYRVLCRLLGLLLAPFSLSMLTAMPFALYWHEWAAMGAFASSMLIGLALSGALYLVGRRTKESVFRRETLAVTSLAWILAAGLGGLPFLLSGSLPAYADCYFESMSGLTTTGASAFSAVEDLPRSILYWRSFLHFLGGLGIVVLFVAVLPLVGVGARALYKQESPGPVPEGMTPRIRDTAMLLLRIYIGLNVVEMVMLMLAGMGFFDALNHAMATIATGGFSTRNASIISFRSPWIEWILALFMYLSSLNFANHADLLRGRFTYFRSAEFRTFTAIVVVASVFFATVVYFHGSQAVSHPGEFNIRDGFFTTLTLMSTTGFGTIDFDQWPQGTRLIALLAMFAGGCAGSTAGGLKIIRCVILAKVVAHELGRAVWPRRVAPLKVDGRIVERETIHEVLVFFLLYIAVFVTGSLVIALLMPDQSLLASMSAAATTLSNVGPGLEAVGPTMNFSGQSAPAKWTMSFLMLLGRLELFPVLAMFAKSFWTAR